MQIHFHISCSSVWYQNQIRRYSFIFRFPVVVFGIKKDGPIFTRSFFYLKGSERIISSYPPWKDGNSQFTFTVRVPLKEMSFCLKLYFCNPYIFATRFRWPKIFQTMKSVRSKSVSMKYQKFTPSGLQKYRD